MKITFLSDNKTEDVRCQAEWGLSMLIEAGGHKVLYDAGSSELFARNAAAMGVRLTDVECCMISHGHYDHTNGLEAFCQVNAAAPIYMHKLACSPAYGVVNGVIEEENCGIQLSNAFVQALRQSGRLHPTEGVCRVNDCMTLVGNIPVPAGHQPTEKFVRPVTGGFEADSMEHEQFLVVEEGERIHIISGCSHKGILHIIRYAKELFPGRPIASVVGGLHTYPLKSAEREAFAEQLAAFGIEQVVPLHCTGMRMIVTLKARLGRNCRICCAGDTIKLV